MTDDAALMDPAIADEAREQAQQARATSTQARADAESLQATAREEARRLLAHAETQARDLTATAKTADKTAEALEQRARVVDHAQAMERQAVEAEQRAADLDAERDALTARIADLTGRLADLGAQREDANAARVRAGEAGDVEAVTRAWTTQTAIDEVVAALTAQVEAAHARAAAIGEPGAKADGEYDQAADAAARYRQELSDALDALDPTRPDRRTAALVNEYRAALVARGVPDDEALATAAFLVAASKFPEAARAALGALEPAVETPAHMQVLLRADGAVAAGQVRG